MASNSTSQPQSSGPLPIRRLEESVINRIAAGEIIHRPSSALKELLENSLDAGSTSIKITVKDGGMKLLQIQDNGCGIRKEDLPILAERFTTSKISTYQDLETLQTYGFRGEALASISYVSHLTVITKTKASACAWKATYADGSIISRDDSSAEPKACAGNDGTMINVEDLFYNTPSRLSALRSSSEEYSRILDVVTKYAIHNPHVSFTCKKAGSATPDLGTPSQSSVNQAIRLLYGQTVAKDLLHMAVSLASSAEDDSDVQADADSAEGWSAEAYFTNPNYQAKKMILLLFINHRLVESSRIKKSLEVLYTAVLPRGTSPFIYLSLQIDPHTIDVNVHPTKREVHFLDEEDIIQRVCDAMNVTLIGGSHSREFQCQTLLSTPNVAIQSKSQTLGKGKERAIEDESVGSDADEETSKAAAQRAAKKILSQHKVRTSQADRTLDSMFPISNPSQLKDDNGSSGPLKLSDIPKSEVMLRSVEALRKSVDKGRHQELTEIIRNHTFVGIVDLQRCLSLVQHAKKLYLINHGALAEEFFYQLGLRQFGDYHRIILEPAPSLRKLITLAVEAEEGVDNCDLGKGQIIDIIYDRLMQSRDMLQEYFSLSFSESGMVESLPLLLKGYTPNLDKLPLFLMRLGPQVNWTSEIDCFQGLLRELAYFYVPEPLYPEVETSGPPVEDHNDEEGKERAIRWQIQHVIFPAVAKYLVAPKTLLDRDVVQVANLPDLYRVFERC